MPDYDEIIQQSQENVNALALKLKELDQLHQDIKKLINQPEVFDLKFSEVVDLANDYTSKLGSSVKMYLEGSNTIFTVRLKEMEVKLGELEIQITRLVNTNFKELFKSLQLEFIELTRKDFEIELKKVDEKTILFQDRLDDFRLQIERLEKIDLNRHFNELQKVLSEIFVALNGVNLTLTNLLQTVSGIVQTLVNVQATLDRNHNETNLVIKDFRDATYRKVANLERHVIERSDLIQSEIKSLSEENAFLRKEIKTNRVIQIVGVVFILLILAIKIR
jgi:hypothetical protein